MAKVKKFGFGGMFGGRGRPAPQPPMNPGMQPQLGQAVRAGIPPAELQRLQQMQGMLQGTPIGGNPRQIAQLPATQMPTAQTGLGSPMGMTPIRPGTPTGSFKDMSPENRQANQDYQKQLMSSPGFRDFYNQQDQVTKDNISQNRTKLGLQPYKKGGAVKKKLKKMASGGKVSSASKRADGCCVKGKTRGKMV